MALRLCTIKEHSTAAVHRFQRLASRGPIHFSRKSSELDDDDAGEISKHAAQVKVENLS